MIFPEHCKYVGYAATQPAGSRVYFLSRFLIRETPEGYEILSVELDDADTGLMRPIRSAHVLAMPHEIEIYPDRVNLHHRADLIRRALASRKRCTIFRGFDEHMTFVLEPDQRSLLPVHVYDIQPPLPHLSGTVDALDRTGLFGKYQAVFTHHIRDIREIAADVYPCRAAGFVRTLDADRIVGGERVAGCQTGRQIIDECYGEDVSFIDICPANAAEESPFIARCCRSERTGLVHDGSKTGGIVHWGASPREIAEMIIAVLDMWRKEHEDRSG